MLLCKTTFERDWKFSLVWTLIFYFRFQPADDFYCRVPTPLDWVGQFGNTKTACTACTGWVEAAEEFACVDNNNNISACTEDSSYRLG